MISITVYDDQASESLIAIGYLHRKESWISYLNGCRAVEKATGRDLRTVDRALFTANGRSNLPSGIPQQLIVQQSAAPLHWGKGGTTPDDTLAAGNAMASAIAVLLAWNDEKQ